MFRVMAVALLALAMCSARAEDAFFLADDADSAPYISADAQKKPVGMFAEIMKEAFRRMNVPLRHEVFPWTRAQAIVEKKEADALLTAQTPARLEYLTPSQEIVFAMKYKIFTQNDNPNLNKIKAVKSLDDLAGLKIVDYIGDGWAKKNLSQFDIEWSPNLTSACIKIAAHRGDVFIQDEVMVWYAIKNYKAEHKGSSPDFDRITTFDAPVEPVRFYLLVRKDSKFVTILPKFDETIREMRKEGLIDKIKNKWIQ